MRTIADKKIAKHFFFLNEGSNGNLIETSLRLDTRREEESVAGTFLFRGRTYVRCNRVAKKEIYKQEELRALALKLFSPLLDYSRILTYGGVQ